MLKTPPENILIESSQPPNNNIIQPNVEFVNPDESSSNTNNHEDITISEKVIFGGKIMTFYLSDILMIISSLFLLFKTPILFLIGRFFQGTIVGSNSVITCMFVTEFVPPMLFNEMSFLITIFIVLGQVFSFAMGSMISIHNEVQFINNHITVQTLYYFVVLLMIIFPWLRII